MCLIVVSNSFVFNLSSPDQRHRMGDYEVKPGKKRTYSRINSQQKRRRLELKPESIQSSTIDKLLKLVQSTTVTDLSDECLEVIFVQLDLQDFLNVAASNKWLNLTAGSIFRRLHGHKTINFETNANENSNSLGIDNMLLINGFSSCLRCLRCFGPYISNMGIQFTGTTIKQAGHISHYLNEYCAESLQSITFKNAPNLIGMNEQKQCPNVKSVYITESQLIQQLPNLNLWFPNLNRLELINNTFDPKFGAAHFPHLTEFRFFVICHYKSRISLKKFLSRFFKSNSHIQSIEIDIQRPECKDILKFRDFLFMMKKNSSVVKLKTNYGLGSDIDIDHLHLLAKTLPSLVEIDFRAYTFTVSEANILIRQLKLLKYFRCGIWQNYDQFRAQLDDEWQMSFESFIHSSLITLTR